MRSLFLTLATVLPLTAQELPPTYVCGRTEAPPNIDGMGNDWQWQNARELSPLRDIEGAAIPHECRIKMLWDDDYLYILADMDEKHLWATLSEHDSVIYRDPDFEVFIDPDGDGLNYIELEINALNTTWDLFIPRPYRFDDPHILHDWEIPGLKHAVHLRGTLNDASDTDDGWSVELAIPWSSITSHATQPRTSKAPAPGSEMRFNFSRVNWQVRPAAGGYEKLDAPESNHVWAPTGKVNIHLPEHWGRVIFSDQPAWKWVAAPAAPQDATRMVIFQALNDQLAHRGQHGCYNPAATLPEGVSISFPEQDFFILTATCPQTGTRMRLDSEGRFKATAPQQQPTELYLWVHGNNERSAAEWTTRFRSYAQAGIGTIIIDGTPERIEQLTALARQEGLRVFAWLWALNRPGDAEALQHPEWYAVNKLGKSCHKPEDRPFVEYYQFLCPSNKEVRRHLIKQVRRLAQIPGLSGIQADYMRMPDVELPRALWEKYGLDMSTPAPEFDYCYCPTCQEGAARMAHNDFRKYQTYSVYSVFNEIADEIRRHGLTAACAVFPSPALAARMVHQDWKFFHADLVLPMAYHSFYNEPAKWAADITRQAMQECEARIPMAPGIHLPDIPVNELPAQLDRLRTTGVHGIGIFSDDELRTEHLQAIRTWLDTCRDAALTPER